MSSDQNNEDFANSFIYQVLIENIHQIEIFHHLHLKVLYQEDYTASKDLHLRHHLTKVMLHKIFHLNQIRKESHIFSLNKNER